MSLKVIELKGRIKLITGLHIGAGNDDIHIGGIDDPVVKDRDGYPYIPGSSLKGKIRSLLEIEEGSLPSGEVFTSKNRPDSIIPVMFGDSEDSRKGITRLIFRDSFLSADSKKVLIEKSLLATESKAENTINRIQGTAKNPRYIERAISDLEFDYEILIRILEEDSEERFKQKLIHGMKMLEKDALGGKGSRGYGKIEFINNTWNGETIEI